MVDLFPLARPILHALQPETAHNLTLVVLKLGLGPRMTSTDPPPLAIEVFGKSFANPIGIAAGFDKNAEVIRPLQRLGLGFVEIGSVTPRPQKGNPKPRMLRWREEEALINRIGFSGVGLDRVEARLKRPRPHGIVGANLGKNKDTTEPEADYARSVRRIARLVDYLVVNVSSPNTPGLRDLQAASALTEIVTAVQAARSEVGATTPILLKIAPDLSDEDLADVVRVALDKQLDGLIVSNTTISRPDNLPTSLAGEAGGLSGPPLMPKSTDMLRAVARDVAGRIPLVGVGGVASGADAYAKIQAGASLVQLYTALAYRGPRLVAEIKRDLAALLDRDGFSSVSEAVGSGV
ncbi:MAG: quinone-dependent dihydroorotate dehydrogenase [Pseudomonadota bacterium]